MAERAVEPAETVTPVEQSQIATPAATAPWLAQGLTPTVVESLQRSAGNAAVTPALMRASGAPSPTEDGRDLNGLPLPTSPRRPVVQGNARGSRLTPEDAGVMRQIRDEAAQRRQQPGSGGGARRAAPTTASTAFPTRSASNALLRQPATAPPKTGKKQAAPTSGTWEFVRREPGGGETTQVDRARVGDQLVVRLKLDEPGESFGPESTSISGLREFKQNSSGRWADKRTYELAFEAATIGKSSLIINIQLRDVPAFKTTLQTDVEMNRQEFLNLTTQANTKIDNGYKATKKWFLAICIAYGDAYKNHTDALKDQLETERLVESLVMGAALAFVPGGVGGVIGAAMKRKGAGDFMIDGVKDLAKYGLRSTGQVGLQGGVPIGADAGGLTAFPTDPLQWRNMVEIAVEDESLKVGQKLEGWQDRVNKNDASFALNFNPIEAIDQALAIAGNKLESLPQIDQKKTADDFEKGMWKAWLEQFGYTMVMKQTLLSGFKDYVVWNVGKKVKKRCEQLGIDVEKYAEPARERMQKIADEHNRTGDHSSKP